VTRSKVKFLPSVSAFGYQIDNIVGGRRDRDRMVVGFTTICAVSA